MKKLKNVLTIWTIVYALITSLFYVLGEWLIIMPLYLQTMLLSGIMVFGMQYVILPTLESLKFYQIKNQKKWKH